MPTCRSWKTRLWIRKTAWVQTLAEIATYAERALLYLYYQLFQLALGHFFYNKWWLHDFEGIIHRSWLLHVLYDLSVCLKCFSYSLNLGWLQMQIWFIDWYSLLHEATPANYALVHEADAYFYIAVTDGAVYWIKHRRQCIQSYLILGAEQAPTFACFLYHCKSGK